MRIRVPVNNRSATLRCYHRRAIRRRLQGLTTQGKPRHRNVFPIPVKERNRRMLARYYQRRDRFFERGLTSRGTRRRIRTRIPPTEQGWRKLRDTIAMPRAVSWDLSEYENES